MDAADLDFQQSAVSELTAFDTSILGIKTILDDLGAEKGLKNYDRTNDIETLLKNLVNFHKDTFSAVYTLVNNLPILGPLLGPSKSRFGLNALSDVNSSCSRVRDQMHIGRRAQCRREYQRRHNQRTTASTSGPHRPGIDNSMQIRGCLGGSMHLSSALFTPLSILHSPWPCLCSSILINNSLDNRYTIPLSPTILRTFREAKANRYPMFHRYQFDILKHSTG